MPTTTTLRLVSRHEVPTHLQVEDKAFFGLAAPQFLCLLLGATLALGLWREWTFLPPVARLGLAGVCALAGVAGAFIRPAGRDLVTWAFVVLHYVALPKTAVWRPRAPDVLPRRASSTSNAAWVDRTPRLAWAPSGGPDAAGVPRRPPGHSEASAGPGRATVMILPGLPSLFRRLLQRRAGGGPGRPSVALAKRAPRASVQEAHVSLEAVDGDVLCLRGGQYRAVLEVEGVPFRLLRDGEQEALLAGWRAFLNGLTFPVQLLVRAVPRDLERHAVEVERRLSAAGTAAGSPEALATLGHDYARYVRGLARRRTLMERRFYVVVPADLQQNRSAPGGAPEDLVRRVRWLPFLLAPWPFSHAGRRRAGGDGATRAGGGGRGGTDAQGAPDDVRARLAFRCDELTRQLERCRLPARRLAGSELAQLHYACWCPERARAHPLSPSSAPRAEPAVSPDLVTRASPPQVVRDVPAPPAEKTTARTRSRMPKGVSPR